MIPLEDGDDGQSQMMDESERPSADEEVPVRLITSEDLITNQSELKRNIDLSFMYYSFGVSERSVRVVHSNGYLFHVVNNRVEEREGKPGILVLFEKNSYLTLGRLTVPGKISEFIAQNYNKVYKKLGNYLENLREFPSFTPSVLTIGEVINTKTKCVKVFGSISSSLYVVDIAGSVEVICTTGVPNEECRVIKLFSSFYANDCLVTVHGKYIFMLKEDKLLVYDTEIIERNKQLESIKFVSDKKLVIKIRMGDTNSMRKKNKGSFTAIFTNGKTLLVGDSNGNVYLGEITGMQGSDLSMYHIRTCKKSISTILLGNEYLYIASGEKIGVANIPSLSEAVIQSNSLKVVKTLHLKGEKIDKICLNQDQSQLATITTSGILRIFHGKDNHELIFKHNLIDSSQQKNLGARKFSFVSFTFVTRPPIPPSNEISEYLVVCEKAGTLMCVEPRTIPKDTEISKKQNK